MHVCRFKQKSMERMKRAFKSSGGEDALIAAEAKDAVPSELATFRPVDETGAWLQGARGWRRPRFWWRGAGHDAGHQRRRRQHPEPKRAE